MEWRNLKVWVKRNNPQTGVMEDYTGLYLVSSDSDIKTIDGETLAQFESTKMPPYKAVILVDRNGKKRERLVHRIVATSFPEICGEPNEVVNHLDENKLSNAAINLRWTTWKENLQYGTSRERAVANRGKRRESPKPPRPQLVNYNERYSRFC